MSVVIETMARVRFEPQLAGIPEDDEFFYAESEDSDEDSDDDVVLVLNPLEESMCVFE